MPQPKIELLKPRDFSELINDTFLFVRQNFKPLITCFFTFCGFFLIAGAAALCIQQFRLVHVFNTINSGDPEAARSFTTLSNLKFLGVDYLVAFVFILLNQVLISVTVFSYMALYREKKGVAPTVNEVWGYIRYYFFRCLGASVVLGILVAVGFVFCFAPGIWLAGVFSLILPIIIFENTSFGYAFNQSFRLIKDNWWTTFGALFVMYIIVAVAAGIVTLPASIMNSVGIFLHPEKGPHFSIVWAIVTVILQQICTVLYQLPNITIGLAYFNLTEIKEGTGLLGRMENFGNPNAAPDDITPEEY